MIKFDNIQNNYVDVAMFTGTSVTDKSNRFNLIEREKERQRDTCVSNCLFKTIQNLCFV